MQKKEYFTENNRLFFQKMYTGVIGCLSSWYQEVSHGEIHRAEKKAAVSLRDTGG